MLRRFALFASLAGLIASRGAAADDADPRATFGLGKRPAATPNDPRDVFGLGKKPVEPPPTCDDGTAFHCAMALDPFDDVSPYALRTRLTATYLLRLPVADARHDAVAHYALGASRDEAGPVFAGATGLENLWTVEGAPAESLRTGNIESRIPLTFLDSMLVIAGGFAARDRASTGGTIEARLRRGTAHHELEAHAWTSLYSTDARTRPVARATYSLRKLSFVPRGEVAASVVGTGPLPGFLGGRAWYAAGIAPNVGRTDVEWRSATIVDLDGDGTPDGLPGIVQTQPIGTTTEAAHDYSIPVMARAGWSRGPHALELTLLGSAIGETFYFQNATQQAAGVDRRFWVGDAIANYRGTWRDTRVKARLAWHRSARYESAHDPDAAGIAQLQTAYIPTTLADDPALAAACDDTSPDDPHPTITNCPVPFGFFISGGAGLLTDSVGDKPSGSIDVAHRIGPHVLRAGAMLEDSRLLNTSRFTNNELVRSLFDGHLDHQRFYNGVCTPDPTMPCDYVSEFSLAYRTRYTAAYAEDTFAVAPNIQLNGGVRWELMWVGPYLHLSKQIAPRLGLAWDVLGGGASRLFASMGRSFIMLHAGIGPTIIERPSSVRDVESPFGVDRNTDGGASFPVADDIRPAAQDEATVGFELGRARTARAAIWLQGRTLRRGYETVLSNPETFDISFDNPGRDGAAPASRNSAVFAIEVTTDPAAQTVVRASYLYGTTTGTYAGPFDPRQGSTNYAGSDWDVESANYHGRLPTDPGHRFFVEGARRGRLGSVDLAVATRLTVASGRPRNVLGDTDLGIVYLLPRGSAGRAPAVSQANVRLAARWRGFDLTLDVFNVFDRQTATSQDEIYAGLTVRPIVDGTDTDLVFLKNSSGGDPVRRSGFRLPFAFQAPIGGTLGIHRAF